MSNGPLVGFGELLIRLSPPGGNCVGYPLDSMNWTTPRDWVFTSPEKAVQRYQWSQPGTGADPFA